MEFGVLFTSHPNPQEEPYPHRDVHARTTDEIVEAERLGYDTAWIAEHHFATSYGIMPDCLKLFAERVIPAFRPPARQVAAAE
jgi:alkanesulfonate monooxygenase SsuD/methylene tetrahydromethanopterin reductase-like flavin-dependent oxidoreductase (luciferase family)